MESTFVQSTDASEHSSDFNTSDVGCALDNIQCRCIPEDGDNCSICDPLANPIVHLPINPFADKDDLTSLCNSYIHIKGIREDSFTTIFDQVTCFDCMQAELAYVNSPTNTEDNRWLCI